MDVFHLIQFLLYIVLVACYIILPYGIKNCTLVKNGKAALLFLLFFDIIDQRRKSRISAKGYYVSINFHFLWISNIISVIGGQVSPSLEEPCFCLISYAMLHHLLWSCMEWVSCLHVSWEPFLIIFCRESFIYSTATVSRLKSKIDTCLLPFILSHAIFCKGIIST